MTIKQIGVAALLLIAVVAGAANGQTQTDTAKRQQLASAIIAESSAPDVIDAILPGLFKALEPLIDNQKGRKITAAQKQALEAVVRKVMKDNLPKYLDDLAQVYADHFSAEELEAIKAFQESDIGKKMTAFQPQFIQQSYIIANQWVKTMQPQMMKELDQALKQKKF